MCRGACLFLCFVFCTCITHFIFLRGRRNGAGARAQALDLALTLGTPSLKACTRLTIRGFVVFSPLITFKGSVRKENLLYSLFSLSCSFDRPV